MILLTFFVIRVIIHYGLSPQVPTVPLLKSPRRLAGHVGSLERKRERINRIDRELYLILAVALVWPFLLQSQ